MSCEGRRREQATQAKAHSVLLALGYSAFMAPTNWNQSTCARARVSTQSLTEESAHVGVLLADVLGPELASADVRQVLHARQATSRK